jgi:hypothetical protein
MAHCWEQVEDDGKQEMFWLETGYRVVIRLHTGFVRKSFPSLRGCVDKSSTLKAQYR